MRLTLIVAASENDVIGRDGALPWHLAEDLRRFRRLTMGKPVIMGRATFDAIGRPLPGRRNIVISRQPGLHIEGCEVVADPAAALATAAPDDEAMVIGGGRIYEALLPQCGRIELTRVHVTVDGDTWFRIPDPGEWRETAIEHFPAHDGQPEFTCSTLERVTG